VPRCRLSRVQTEVLRPDLWLLAAPAPRWLQIVRVVGVVRPPRWGYRQAVCESPKSVCRNLHSPTPMRANK
jgi:hypothetical protein